MERFSDWRGTPFAADGLEIVPVARGLGDASHPPMPQITRPTAIKAIPTTPLVTRPAVDTMKSILWVEGVAMQRTRNAPAT